MNAGGVLYFQEVWGVTDCEQHQGTLVGVCVLDAFVGDHTSLQLNRVLL